MSVLLLTGEDGILPLVTTLPGPGSGQTLIVTSQRHFVLWFASPGTHGLMCSRVDGFQVRAAQTPLRPRTRALGSTSSGAREEQGEETGLSPQALQSLMQSAPPARPLFLLGCTPAQRPEAQCHGFFMGRYALPRASTFDAPML